MFAKRCGVIRIVLFVSLALGLDVATASAQAESIVRGLLVAAADGSVLAVAPVVLTQQGTGEALQTTTDAAGVFVFPRVRPGEYVLSASVEGFATRELRLVLEPREVRSVTLGLEVARVAVNVSVPGDAELPSYRATDNPVHTTVWPDSRIYSYASFDRGRAHGIEVKADAPGLLRYGITSYVNYAVGRVNFYNPVSAGFVTEAAHITETNRFVGPMDQTHTMTAGLTYDHARTGLSIGTAVEYGSGTPTGYESADHDHSEGEAAHEHSAPDESTSRAPAHFIGNVSLGVNLVRDVNRRPKLTLQLDIKNVANDVYLIAKEGEFSPTQFSVPRLFSVTAKLRF